MKKTSKIFLLMALICTLIFCGMVSASALDAKGKCGDNINYTYDAETGALVIKGKGEMYDYDDGKSPFYNSDIKSVTVKKGITRVGSYAFELCDELNKATITDTVKAIGSSAFLGCGNLESIKLPKKLEKIGYGTFKDCFALESITLPGNLKSIGGSAFSGCISLKSIIIPDSVTTVNSSAFVSCLSLETVEIGKNVNSLGLNTFGGCSNLKEITVDENNKNYASQDGALLNKDKTKLIKYASNSPRTEYTMPNSVETIGENAFAESSYLEKIRLSDNLEKISLNAFFDCRSLKSITIPGKVSSILGDAFYWCSSLEEIKVAENNETYSAVNGVLFSKDKTTLIKYPEGKNTKAYAIPKSVRYIYINAFYDAKFEKVFFEDNVLSIGENAFCSCDNLRSITVPGSVKEIGSGAFMECSNLKTVTIGTGAEYIYDYAFADCSNLTEIELGAGLKRVYENAFEGCNNLSKVYFNGIKDQWNTVYVEDGNDCLVGASVEFVDKCNCHKTGFMGFIYKIQLFFWKLFKSNQYCICGTVHY